MDQEKLILIAPTSSIKKGTKPISNRTDPSTQTISMHLYEVLTQNPYVFTSQELLEEVHVNRRGKTGLKLETYNLRRLELCKLWGWGIHVDKNEKLALVGCETDKYRELIENQTIKKQKALNPTQAQVLTVKRLLEQNTIETKVFQLRLDVDLYEWMDDHVNIEHTTKADLIRKLLKEYRENQDTT